MVEAMRFVCVWMQTSLRRFSDERGASAVEYGVMVALIAAVIVVAVGILGGQIKGAFCGVVSALNAKGFVGACP
jgi:pilus assembly protein Flp/PilA